MTVIVDSIILVDDEHITNFVNKRIIELAELCSDVTSFVLAKECLNYIKDNFEKGIRLPDYIFVDINMPEMTGWGFIEEYSKLDDAIKKQIKVYLLSSSQNEDDLIKASSNPNISGFLGKPLTEQKLLGIIG
jgi:CheY-like chemotaxis protein